MTGVESAAPQERVILVVDDETSVLAALQRALRREGLRIVSASSADNAMAWLGANPLPQVIISDFRMPGTDGLAFLRDVRMRWPNVQRILLTGFADIAALERAVNETEIFRYLAKPWDNSLLLTTVHSALEEWSLREEHDRLLALTTEQNQRLGELNRALEARVSERTQQLELAKRDWEATFDSIATPVAIIDRDYVVRRSNLTYAQYTGKDVREVPGKRCHEVLVGEKEPCRGCPVSEVLETKKSARGEVVDRQHDRFLQVSAYPSFSSAGELAHIVCHYHDVTEEKELQQRLLQAEKLSGIGLLAGGVAHEINNPLGGILAFTQLLKREVPKDHEHFSFLKEIEDSALRCKRIVESLLKFARRSSAHEREPVIMNEVLGSTIFLIEHQYLLQNVEIIKDLEPALWPVKANANQLSQVLLNLLTNAFGAMPKGGRIFVKTWNDDGAGAPMVRVSVRDTGSGIAEKNLAKIFEPFFTTKGEGTGLGLVVTEEIVQAHGGRVDVKSEVGQGAEFVVSLPAMGSAQKERGETR